MSPCYPTPQPAAPRRPGARLRARQQRGGGAAEPPGAAQQAAVRDHRGAGPHARGLNGGHLRQLARCHRVRQRHGDQRRWRLRRQEDWRPRLHRCILILFSFLSLTLAPNPDPDSSPNPMPHPNPIPHPTQRTRTSPPRSQARCRRSTACCSQARPTWPCAVRRVEGASPRRTVHRLAHL
eukprot:scaffold17340_cov50-Phaeocystis_antarctica.AAC.1